MFDNCKTCLFYNSMYDNMCREEEDEIIEDEPIFDKHFCVMWDDNEPVIPKDVWEHRTKCPHYVKPK